VSPQVTQAHHLMLMAKVLRNTRSWLFIFPVDDCKNLCGVYYLQMQYRIVFKIHLSRFLASSLLLLSGSVFQSEQAKQLSYLRLQPIERFSFNLEIITREHNQNNKRTRKREFNWFSEHRQTRVTFGWFSEHGQQTQTVCVN